MEVTNLDDDSKAKLEAFLEARIAATQGAYRSDDKGISRWKKNPEPMVNETYLYRWCKS